MSAYRPHDLTAFMVSVELERKRKQQQKLLDELMEKEEAPKKIWWDVWDRIADENQDDESEIPYIRADIVDELVEALKLTLKSHGSAYMSDSTILRIKAALAKLEESHEV